MCVRVGACASSCVWGVMGMICELTATGWRRARSIYQGGMWGIPDRQVQEVAASCAAATRLDVSFFGLGFPKYRVVAAAEGCEFPWAGCGSILGTLYDSADICQSNACSIAVELPTGGRIFTAVSVQGVEPGVTESGYWDAKAVGSPVVCPALGDFHFHCPVRRPMRRVPAPC